MEMGCFYFILHGCHVKCILIRLSTFRRDLLVSGSRCVQWTNGSKWNPNMLPKAYGITETAKDDTHVTYKYIVKPLNTKKIEISSGFYMASKKAYREISSFSSLHTD